MPDVSAGWREEARAAHVDPDAHDADPPERRQPAHRRTTFAGTAKPGEIGRDRVVAAVALADLARLCPSTQLREPEDALRAVRRSGLEPKLLPAPRVGGPTYDREP